MSKETGISKATTTNWPEVYFKLIRLLYADI